MQVLSEDNKFRSFDGMKRELVDEIVELYFDDETFLFLTPEHEVYINGNYREARYLKIGDILHTPNGTKEIIYKERKRKKQYVYDFVNIEETNNYFANKTLIHQCLYLDEFSFVNNAEEFYTSTYPVIASGKNTKIIITSTPNGQGNPFHTLWTGAITKSNEFVPLKVTWDQFPGRDEAWKRETIRNTSERQFSQEHESVGYNTHININNDIIKIGDYYQSQPSNDHLYMDNINNDTILTPNGLESFKGIQKIVRDSYAHLFFSNGNDLICSLEHPIKTDKGIVKAKNLSFKSKIETSDGFCFLSDKKIVNERIELFDIVDSGTDHLYYTNDIVSHNCNFLGNSNTLIDGNKLMGLSAQKPAFENEDETFRVFKQPIEEHEYVMAVDVAKGRGKDYSTFSIIDITSRPFEQVAVFRDSNISPLIYSSILFKYATQYNNAYTIIESNDNGSMVANSLIQDMEYENVFSEIKAKKHSAGLEMNKRVKSIGCSTLKDLIEQNQLLVHDKETINELTTFVMKGTSYAASGTNHDDMVMSLVVFAWLSSTDFFKSLTDINIREEMFEKQMKEMQEELAPIGVLGSNDPSNDFSLDYLSRVNQMEEFAGQMWTEVEI